MCEGAESKFDEAVVWCAPTRETMRGGVCMSVSVVCCLYMIVGIPRGSRNRSSWAGVNKINQSLQEQ